MSLFGSYRSDSYREEHCQGGKTDGACKCCNQHQERRLLSVYTVHKGKHTGVYLHIKELTKESNDVIEAISKQQCQDLQSSRM